ncbi:MAG TPA: hypothetical protein VF721_01950 [Pyrinomonadaceae bacterium]|jgi:hypothetical protein
MKLKIVVAIAVLLLGCGGVLAQNGGKAEPNRIKFAKGKSAAIVSGIIRGDEQAEYVFRARRGQNVLLKITSVWDCCASFRILDNVAPPDFITEYPANWAYYFNAPYTGDYLIWVSNQHLKNSKSDAAKYKLILTVK